MIQHQINKKRQNNPKNDERNKHIKGEKQIMPLEIIAETMVNEEIMKGIKETDLELSNNHFLLSITQALQESMKIQRDILSELEALTERLNNSKEKVTP